MRIRAEIAVGAAVAFAVSAALHAPLLANAPGVVPEGAFHGAHVWSFDHLWRIASGDAPLALETDRIGYPLRAETRFLGWAPAILSLLPRVLGAGPLLAYDLVLLATPALTVAAAAPLARRLTGCSPAAAAAAAAAWVLCPYALTSLANGQLEKAQLWTLALYLLAAHACFEKPGPARLAAVAGGAALTSLTCPSTGLAIPLLAGTLAAVRIAAVRRWSAVAACAGLLAATATGLLPAAAWFGAPEPDPPVVAAFEPAHLATEQDVALVAGPTAQPEDLLLGHGADPARVNHVAYLTLPLLLGAAALSLRPFPGRGLAWSFVAAGVLFALGPWLRTHGAPVELGGLRIALPSLALDALGYPLARSGMYYRVAVAASLGLSLALAGGSTRLRHGGLLAVALAALAIADGVRDTRALWPRPARTVPGAEALLRMAADPVPGAVFDVPAWTGPHAGPAYLLAAALHGRTTTALPRATFDLSGTATEERFLREVLAEGDPARARARLRARGYRYLVAHPELPPAEFWSGSPEPPLTADRIALGLGEPAPTDGPLVWVLEAP